MSWSRLVEVAQQTSPAVYLVVLVVLLLGAVTRVGCWTLLSDERLPLLRTAAVMVINQTVARVVPLGLGEALSGALLARRGALVPMIGMMAAERLVQLLSLSLLCLFFLALAPIYMNSEAFSVMAACTTVLVVGVVGVLVVGRLARTSPQRRRETSGPGNRVSWLARIHGLLASMQQNLRFNRTMAAVFALHCLNWVGAGVLTQVTLGLFELHPSVVGVVLASMFAALAGAISFLPFSAGRIPTLAFLLTFQGITFEQSTAVLLVTQLLNLGMAIALGLFALLVVTLHRPAHAQM